MELLSAMHLDELSLRFSQINMYPLFDIAHYIISVLALKEQAGTADVAQRSPLACWVSAMIYCFGGAMLSSLLLAEPLIAPLSNNTNIFLASFIWYIVFYCPGDLAYKCFTFQPLRLVLAGMKEVTRTWKVVGGVTQGQKYYKDGWLAIIAVGWSRGAGGGLLANFEQLVRGIWKPETNELLKMTYATKVTLIGSVLFTFQQRGSLPLAKHHFMLIYSVFLVVLKVRMMIGGPSMSPFSAFETLLFSSLFGWQKQASEKGTSALTAGKMSPTSSSAASANDVKESEERCPDPTLPDTNANILETERKKSSISEEEDKNDNIVSKKKD
ncbi:trimeric intracellular cation channel type B [Erpetoichthys calabaricus]|uniref:Transmembrane protein 38B n=1 Tax=Erpetoichthys calabaricus TaxID=27687 RepID=A0A8C4X8H5_ERPCA|nr:trimeric intracellular cation channel type B [Erpetoichthys calabaricus]